MVSPVTGCITFHCGSAFAGEMFKNDGVNCTCCAGVNPTGTVAVVGVVETRIPVSIETIAVPVFLWSASAVAVNVIVGMGFGKFANVGAVYVNTLLGAVGVSVHVPIVPVPPCNLSPLLQVLTVTCFGAGVCVVGVGVYTYEQVHAEVVVVEPVTVAEKVCTVPAITIAVLGDTVTATVLGLELPHPLCHNIIPASVSIAAVFIVRHFMNDISLTRATQALTSPASLIPVSCSDGLNLLPVAHLRTCGSP